MAYTETGQPGLVAIGNPAGIDSLDDLCGLAVSAVSGTTHVDLIEGLGEYVGEGLNHACVAAGRPEIDLRPFPTEVDAVQALLDSEVAFYLGNPNFVRDYPDQLEPSPARLPQVRQGITVAKDNPHLFAAVQTAIDAMIADGTYTAILREFFPEGTLENISILE